MADAFSSYRTHTSTCKKAAKAHGMARFCCIGSFQKWIKSSLVLSSLKAVNKGATAFAGGARQSTPHPGLGPGVEPPGSVSRRMINFLRVGKTLSRKSFPAQQPPPRFH